MEHPITPPPKLVQQWASESLATQHLCTQAARWGADQELEACCKWLAWESPITAEWVNRLRAARRPKPPSLKESALNALEHILRHAQTDHGANTIRRALEALPND